MMTATAFSLMRRGGPLTRRSGRGGDAVRGPALAAQALADGRRAALSIAKTLGL